MGLGEWREDPGNPLIRPPPLSPVIADPTFLTPEETPDGLWHLFAHSLFGVHQFVSRDGRAFERTATVVRNALRPFVLRVERGFWLFYEKPRLMLPILPLPWRSHVEARFSTDLRGWDSPVVVLRPELAWHAEARRGVAVGNPCVVELPDGGWRLYYSAGLVFLADCGFCEPRFIGVATADRPEGPYRPEPEPMLGPSTADPRCNLGAGAIKVLRHEGAFLGFQNGIYTDPLHGRSRSAIRLLTSTDGLAWRPAREEPIIAPTTGWKASHVYACDVKRWRDHFVLFFNARDGWHWTRGREAIGAAYAPSIAQGPLQRP